MRSCSGRKITEICGIEEEGDDSWFVTCEDGKLWRGSVQDMTHLNCIIRAFLADARIR